MAMLDRYKKPGGFNQLLTLLETCGPQKQEKFLEIIRQEDPRWADALIAKMIDLNRILTWSDSAIAEVTGTMLDINVAALIAGVTPEQRDRLLGTLAHIKRRKVLDIFEASTKATPSDIATSINKMYETVRKLSQDGILRLDKIDPLLYVDVDIEERLKQGRNIVGVPDFSESHSASPKTARIQIESEPTIKIVTSMSSEGESPNMRAVEQELLALRKRVAALQAENGTLRQELANAHGKLEQIRKIA